jgi:CRP-like cAMP-binding protein
MHTSASTLARSALDRAPDSSGASVGAAAPTGQAAERNRVLLALPPDEYAWVSARLEPVEIAQGEVLAEAQEPFRHVYFPETAVCSVVNVLEDGGVVEIGTVGREGMVGLSAFLDAGASPSRTIGQIPGSAQRAPATLFADGADQRPVLRRVLRRYTHVFLTQVAQTAACNRAHVLEQRCARWLLMTHDRAGRDTFPLTHEFLAFMLGVRRAGVTEALGALQQAGLIRYSRGVITVVDRPALERAACECYRVVRSHFERLFG